MYESSNNSFELTHQKNGMSHFYEFFFLSFWLVASVLVFWLVLAPSGQFSFPEFYKLQLRSRDKIKISNDHLMCQDDSKYIHESVWKCSLAPLVVKNENKCIIVFSTSGASEHFDTSSCTCMYLESARRVLTNEHNLWFERWR